MEHLFKEEVVFDTVEPAVLPKNVLKRRTLFIVSGIPLGFLLLFGGTILEIDLIAQSGFAAWAVSIILAFWHDNKYVFKLVYNGTLRINKEGIQIIQDEQTTFFPFEEIRFIVCKYDRPQRRSSRNSSPPATYKLKIKTASAVHIVFVHYKPVSSLNTPFNDFTEVLQNLQKHERYFYNNIEYQEY